MATQRLTIFMLDDVTEADDAIEEDARGTLAVSELTASSGLSGRFYSRRNTAHAPTWAKYLSSAVEGGIQGVTSASASGLLVLMVDNQAYALTFGYGRSFLDQSKISRRFGLKVALNLIDEKQIRSLDTKLFDEMVVSRNTQTSRTAELPSFGVDILRDIVRAVTGVAPVSSGYKSVSGADALVLGVTSPVEDLPELLRDIHSHYESDKYKGSFGWVDHLAEVKDPVLKSILDDQIVEQLRARETKSTHLAMPENLDWEDIEHFLIAPTRRQQQLTELDLDAYLSHSAARIDELTIDQLKRRKVAVKFNSSASAVDRWSLYQCIVSEQKIDDKLYALVEGRWFEVANSLVNQVDQVVQAIPPMPLALPPAKVGEWEGDYNARVAESDDSFALLDRQLVAPAGANSNLEFCDLIAADGSLVHVKRKSRSSTLSHLFAQGHVSAEALVDDEMREQVRAAIVQSAGAKDPAQWLSFVPPRGDAPARDSVTVTYAIITDSTASGVEWLPFFSRLALMQTVRDLNRLGFMNVALTRVPIDKT